MRILKFGVYLTCVAILTFIVLSSFWQYEVKYALPTPVPEKHKEVCIGEQVAFQHLVAQGEKPMLLHFYNPECPCSKFNIKEYLELTDQFNEQVDFVVVLQSEELRDLAKFQRSYGDDLNVITDPKGEISDVFGIYATPQAVILDTAGVIYYKGNYNKARFCTNKNSRFVFEALQHLLKGEALPAFNEFASIAYGCALPSDTSLITENSFYQNIFQPWN